MFSYYGSKSKLVKYYPKPDYKKIIEPFAGSAQYSLMYNFHEIFLNDRYKVIYDIWDYLINADEQQIKALPTLRKGESLENFDLTYQEILLLGFCVNLGVSTPRKTCSHWSELKNQIEKTKIRILENLSKIRHWKISCNCYLDLPNEDATWFIDPPYQIGGSHYKHNNIDYNQLAEWCKTRKGQVIVCESDKADWLDFRPLTNIRSSRFDKAKEVIWTNDRL